MASLNYKHLYYFWAVAKAGGIARAGERLHLTPQTVSGQVTLFEKVLGYKLFRRSGRGIELTEAGRVVLSYAEDIFAAGEELEQILRDPTGGRPQQVKVGVSDAVPKAIAYRLLEPALRLPKPLRFVCREGKFSNLLADLAAQQLDIVIADSPLPSSASVRGFNHLLGECGVTFFATDKLARQHKARFPRCLDGAPMLLPGEDAAVRPKLLRWFDEQGIRPNIVGEFDDGALLNAFGHAGVGVFPAPSAILNEVTQQYGTVSLGRTDEVTERFFAISAERRLTHPAVVAISSAAREDLFHRRVRSRHDS